MDKYIGKLLDNRYEILEVIGTGGMAIVYKARCHRLNRLVAIKILKDDLSQDTDFRRRFHGESQAVAMLSHTNIVSVYDVSHSDETDYIVMELIDGITLKQYMQQKGVLNWREVLHFSTQIANALEHAHSRGIVHRDIKPHNIMLLKDGSVKVADFGIARITSSQNTLTREALGSVHYISPEQARGSRVDNRSDLYSLGVVMYEMMTGKPPFEGESPVAVAIQHINATPVLPSEANEDIPLGLEQITMHAMTANMDLRYSDAKEILRDLEEFRKNPNATFQFITIDQNTGNITPVAAPVVERKRPETVAERREQPPKKRGNGAAIVAGLLCLALAIGGIAYFLYNFFIKDLLSVAEEVTVPNFVGEQYVNIDQADYPDLVIQEKQWINDDTIPAGEVIKQDPVGETVVKVGTTVSLTMSAGTKAEVMPPLENTTLEGAQSILESLGLNLFVKTEEEYSNAVAQGWVVRAYPAQGETLVAGQSVVLTVSLGSEPVMIPVPALVGQDVEAALAVLDSLGLTRGTVKEVEDDSAAGTVVFQSITQDTMVKEGTVINLHYASGPEEEIPPEEEEETQPEEEEVPPVEEEVPPVTEPTPGEVVLQVPLRSGSGQAECTMYLDNTQYGEVFMVDLGAEYMEVALTGTGTQTLSVYYDGTLGYTTEVVFD